MEKVVVTASGLTSHGAGYHIGLFVTFALISILGFNLLVVSSASSQTKKLGRRLTSSAWLLLTTILLALASRLSLYTV